MQEVFFIYKYCFYVIKLRSMTLLVYCTLEYYSSANQLIPEVHGHQETQQLYQDQTLPETTHIYVNRLDIY